MELYSSCLIIRILLSINNFFDNGQCSFSLILSVLSLVSSESLKIRKILTTNLLNYIIWFYEIDMDF